MLIIKYKGSTADEGTLKAIGEIKTIMNKQCFLSGMSAIMEDTKNLADKEAPFYVVLAVFISLIILILTMELPDYETTIAYSAIFCFCRCELFRFLSKRCLEVFG